MLTNKVTCTIYISLLFFQHESGSIRMFAHLIEKYSLEDEIRTKKYLSGDLEVKQFISLIKQLILGDVPEDQKDKKYLYQVSVYFFN